MADNLSSPSLSPYGAVRVQASLIYGGPRNITVRDLGGEPFYGWATLSLGIRPGRADRLEARAVYANPHDTSQQVAVLRAVAWDGVAARNAVWRRDQEYRLTMPARFVQVPVEQVRTWLGDFEGISVALAPARDGGPGVPIRRLRIEWDYLAGIFERVWQVEDSHYASLNRRWNSVWAQMTTALEAASVITNLDEDFWELDIATTRDVYDYQAYAPRQFAYD